MDPGRSDRLLSRSLGASAGAESAGTSAGAAGASTGTPAGASSCYQHHRDYGDPQPSVLLDWWLQSFLCNFGWLGATTFLTPRWYRLLQLLQTIVIYGQRFVSVIGHNVGIGICKQRSDSTSQMDTSYCNPVWNPVFLNGLCIRTPHISSHVNFVQSPRTSWPMIF